MARKKRTCPTPHKLTFTSEAHAAEVLRYWNYDQAPYRPSRAYPCRCGSWHLSSRI